MNDTMQRAQSLASLNGSGQWDIIVIGGGATGLGAAVEASARGYRTLLLEQSDFAKSTSSKSTKLVHGGVRYMAQGNIGLVREASVERGLLHRNAPHLVRNLGFIIPIYSFFDRIKYTIGLKLYDWIAGRLSLGASVFISKKKTLEKLPNIKSDGLVGGVLYHDGQFDDARLAINLAQTIFDQGGVAINYIKVTGLLKDKGKLSGVTARDEETGAVFSLRAKAVINATGVFVDEILKMDDPAAGKSICVSQGVHIVLDKKFQPTAYALMIPETADGRVLFAVPWHDKLVVGTTDTPVEAASLEPVALEEEIRFILNTAAQYLSAKPERSDVLSVFAGLRPLAAPQGEGQRTKEISRSHKIMVTASGLFTMLGGKWTTYRKMGEDLINRIEKELFWPSKHTPTTQLAVHGYATGMNWADPFYYYGADAVELRKLMNGYETVWISESLHIHEVQVIWAVQHEMARTLEDVLSRRMRALLLDAKECMRIAPPVAAIMARVMGKDEQWAVQQVNEFKELAIKYTLN